jgi:hypothetical protein
MCCNWGRLMILGQKIVKCEVCTKEFLFFGVPSEADKLFCSPDCGEEFEKMNN